jgi:hypothetical protein
MKNKEVSMLVRFADGWYWKTPRREVYSTSFKLWVKSVIWCHVVLRWFQSDLALVRQETL